MLGEKRSQSLFTPKASAEKAAATHITTGPDGRKKELPLYFGPDCPVSGNMGQNQHEAGVGEPQPADEPLRHAPADDGTGVEADPTDSVNMAEDLPRRSLNTESAGGYRAHSLFFTPENEGQDFNTVLQDVQEYISGKYSALITEGGDEDAKAQIKRYITKYVQDRRIAVKGYSGDQLVDALYTEMAEFGLLTKYIFGTGIEEINVNSWRDIEVLYANGETVKLEEHFDSPEHAVNVIRRMLHVSGMVLDNASPAVLGHLSKNIRIAVLKTPLVDEDVGVTASIRIVNPQNMQKEPHYDNLMKEVFMYFARKVQQLRELGLKDIILDPGFGFGKTLEHNYELMAHLEEFSIFELPLLVGVSRKSMIYKLLGGTPQDSLNGTTVLDTVALMKGANILRVHDVREAVEAVRIVDKLRTESEYGK